MARPKEPSRNASARERLEYWKALKAYAANELEDLRGEISKEQKRVRDAKRMISKLEKDLAASTVDWNGKEPVPNLTGEIVLAQRYGLEVTSTTGGAHSPTSYHYQGRAVDVASWSSSGMRKAQKALLKEYGASHFKELFGPEDWYIKNGTRYGGAFPDHGDHIHIAK